MNYVPLKVALDVNSFGRLVGINLYTENDAGELLGIVKPVQLVFEQVSDPYAVIDEPTLKFTLPTLLSVFESLESEMLRQHLISPKIISVEAKDETIKAKDETIKMLFEENKKLHSINKELMGVIKQNV